MALNRLTVKNIISRVKQVFPNVSDAYIVNIINEAIVEIGMYNTKVEYSKTDAVEDQMWYDLSDASSGISINKITRVDFKDTSAEYIKIPRLLNQETQKMDTV